MNTNKSNLYLHSNKFYENIYNKLEPIEKQHIHYFYFQDILSSKYIDIINQHINNLKYDETEYFNNIIYEYLNTIFDITLNSNQQQNDSVTTELKKSLVYKANYMAMVHNECIEHMNILRASYTKYITQSIINYGNVIDINFDNKHVIISDENKRLILGEIYSRYIILYANYENKYNKVPNQLSQNQKNPQSNIVAYKIDEYYKESLYTEISDFNTYELCLKYWFIQLIIIELLFNNNSNYSVLFNSDLFKKEVEEVCKYIKISKEGQKKKKQGQQGKRTGGGKYNAALATLHEPVKNNNKRFNFKKGMKKSYPQQSKQQSKQGNNNKNQFKKQHKYRAIMEKIKINNTSYDKILTLNLRKDIIAFYDKDKSLFDTPKVRSVFASNYTPAEITFKNFLTSAEEKNTQLKKPNKMGDKLNIFNMLWIYLEKNSEIITFIRRVQKYILYTNYMLYYKKKQFYTMFLDKYDKLYRSKLSVINSSPQTIKNIQNKKITLELEKYNIRIHQYIKILLLKKEKLLQMQRELNNSPQSNLKKHIITKQLNYIYIELEKARTSNYAEKIIKNILNKQQKK